MFLGSILHISIDAGNGPMLRARSLLVAVIHTGFEADALKKFVLRARLLLFSGIHPSCMLRLMLIHIVATLKSKVASCFWNPYCKLRVMVVLCPC